MSTHASDGLSDIFRNIAGLDQGDPLDVQTKPEAEGDAPEPWEESAQNGPLDVYEEPKNSAVADGPEASEAPAGADEPAEKKKKD